MFLVISSSFGSFYRQCSTETLKFCFNHNLLMEKNLTSLISNALCKHGFT